MTQPQSSLEPSSSEPSRTLTAKAEGEDDRSFAVPSVVISPDDRLEPVLSRPTEAAAPVSAPAQSKPDSLNKQQPRWVSRYSRFVLLAKVVFPATAMVLAVAVVLWPQMQKVGEETFSISFANVGEVARESQQLLNARYFGTDDKNQAYSVTADLAQETQPGSQVIELTHPQADMTLSDGAWMMLGASKGLYHQGTSTLELLGSISLYHDRGYEVHTERATVLLHEGIARGDAPIKGQGTFGSLEGEGFEIDRQERILKVTGKSRLLLRGGSSEKATPAPAKKANGKTGSASAGKKQ